MNTIETILAAIALFIAIVVIQHINDSPIWKQCRLDHTVFYCMKTLDD